MGQEPTDFLEECTDEPRAVEFPFALLEPPARWPRVEYFDANDLDDIAEEMADQLGWDDEEIAPEASYRRFTFQARAGQFGIYVHRCGELLAPGFVAIAVTVAPEPYIDYGPDFGPDDDTEDEQNDSADDQQVRAFARLANIFGMGQSVDAAAADVISQLSPSRPSK
jgi:hypothetical protein